MVTDDDADADVLTITTGILYTTGSTTGPTTSSTIGPTTGLTSGSTTGSTIGQTNAQKVNGHW